MLLDPGGLLDSGGLLGHGVAASGHLRGLLAEEGATPGPVVLVACVDLEVACLAQRGLCAGQVVDGLPELGFHGYRG